jgi:hypothetical protein
LIRSYRQLIGELHDLDFLTDEIIFLKFNQFCKQYDQFLEPVMRIQRELRLKTLGEKYFENITYLRFESNGTFAMTLENFLKMVS